MKSSKVFIIQNRFQLFY